MSGPSDKAVEAVAARGEGTRETARAALNAAHDPALGLDRSVCLRNVVEALARWQAFMGINPADFIEREFGGGS